DPSIPDERTASAANAKIDFGSVVPKGAGVLARLEDIQAHLNSWGQTGRGSRGPGVYDEGGAAPVRRSGLGCKALDFLLNQFRGDDYRGPGLVGCWHGTATIDKARSFFRKTYPQIAHGCISVDSL